MKIIKFILILSVTVILCLLFLPIFPVKSNIKANIAGAKKVNSMLNHAISLKYALEGETVKDYKTAEELYENLFKTRITPVDGEYVFTGGFCQNGITFKLTSGELICIDKNNYNPEKCDELNTVPCANNPDLPVIYADVNGEKEPNKEILSIKDDNDIVGYTLFSQKVKYTRNYNDILIN